MNQQQSFELLQIYFKICARELSERLWKLLAECFHRIKSEPKKSFSADRIGFHKKLKNTNARKAVKKLDLKQSKKVIQPWKKMHYEYLSNKKTKLEQEVVAKKEYTWRNDS